MKVEELERVIACAELRNPKQYNASRERYIAEISFRAGIKKLAEWLLSDDDMPLQDEYKYPPKTVAQVKAKLKEWGIEEQ